MPGGWAESNLSIKENIAKEAKEESGFFSLEELPPLSLGRNTKIQIEMCFEAVAKEDFFTIFD